ncbi:antitoxin component YwqK of YwqJK toxin-antitoxin module [Tenacibaculum adriaticum]|uniref:Antitoxin component YwqK of YwqJK toxin-antitoxin module n=1 Tax=Tenacibaculum adriaticum TaxID=413713 RepID=A0A5S5DLG0_9FLAO|nr:toxin-antitoxin system YwqK family antitoxin [Tenacibaculum adriaticum]TYP96767.1 antitoxin component YwqK of YwqJK toxin-antitoxin module [Tenacibaculum adriaticum]
MINIKRLFIGTIVFSFFFVSNAISQNVNKVDENGERIGVWRKYYENGKIRYTGNFKEGKEVGTFKFYNKSSSFPSIIKEFSTSSDSAMVKFYTPKGKLKSEGVMIGKNRVGKWMYYFSDGKIFSEEFYVDGKLNGVLKNYYPNGKVTEESHYSNGLKNGISKTFSDDGILIEEVIYADGKLNGLGKYFDLKGNLKEKGMHKDGKRDGKWEFYMDGELAEKKRVTHSIKKQ